jgi:hypothetical protein
MLNELFLSKLEAIVPVLRDEPMARHTTLAIGGPAAAYVAVNSLWTCLPRGAVIRCLEQRRAGGSALAPWAVVRGWRVHDAATRPRRAAALLALP